MATAGQTSSTAASGYGSVSAGPVSSKAHVADSAGLGLDRLLRRR